MEKEIKYLPIVSGSLIFLGYLNLQTYYWWFDINIYSYTNTGEILLSFLEVILYILLLVFCVLLDFFVFTCYVGTGLSNVVNKLAMYLLIYKKVKNNLIKNAIIKIVLIIIGGLVYLLNCFLLILCYGGILILAGGFLSNLAKSDIGFSNFFELFVFIILCYSLIITLIGRMIIIKAINEAVNNVSKNLKGVKEDNNIILSKKNFISEKKFIAIISFLYYVLFTCYNNYLKAKTVLVGISVYDLEFNYMNEKINTKEKNVYYIGQTQDYIFLRNLKNQENLIFGKKDITNLKIGIYPNQTDIEADVIGGTRTQGYVIGTTCTPLDTQHLRKDTLFKTIK